MINFESKVRIQNFWCTFCEKEWRVSVPFGHFTYGDKNGKFYYLLELREERQGRTDKLVDVLLCSDCGCVSGSMDIKDKSAV